MYIFLCFVFVRSFVYLLAICLLACLFLSFFLPFFLSHYFVDYMYWSLVSIKQVRLTDRQAYCILLTCLLLKNDNVSNLCPRSLQNNPQRLANTFVTSYYRNNAKYLYTILSNTVTTYNRINRLENTV